METKKVGRMRNGPCRRPLVLAGVPAALPLSFAVAGDSVADLARSQLVVYRLAPSGRCCVLGMVTGAGDNLKARELAVAHAAAFACGASKRVVR